jgi:ubiquinone/menaquinone biosynthesis C-methylase UbiE
MDTKAMAYLRQFGTSGKRKKSIGIEGRSARWYARNTAGSIPHHQAEARRIAETLKPQDHVLEIAPGPGYFAIALAGLGAWRVSGLDISSAIIEIAVANAAKAGVSIDFRRGDACAMPYPADWFDCVVCYSAFKNFGDPVAALKEIHRVLRPGGVAIIGDMRHDATNRAIADQVRSMELGWFSALITTLIFRYSLRPRAYSREDFLRMAAETAFGSAEIATDPIGLEVRLRK